jgi:hypothetical protein
MPQFGHALNRGASDELPSLGSASYTEKQTKAQYGHDKALRKEAQQVLHGKDGKRTQECAFASLLRAKDAS